jgi:hypothetical protein
MIVKNKNHTMKKIIELLKQTFSLNCLSSIFDNDSHKIVSSKGHEILNNHIDIDKIKSE